MKTLQQQEEATILTGLGYSVTESSEGVVWVNYQWESLRNFEMQECVRYIYESFYGRRQKDTAISQFQWDAALQLHLFDYLEQNYGCTIESHYDSCKISCRHGFVERMSCNRTEACYRAIVAFFTDYGSNFESMKTKTLNHHEGECCH
jgi:hypothetical protein